MTKYVIIEYGIYGKEFDSPEIMRRYVVREDEVYGIIDDCVLDDWDKANALKSFNKSKCFNEYSSHDGDWDDHSYRGLDCMELNAYVDNEYSKLEYRYASDKKSLQSLLEE